MMADFVSQEDQVGLQQESDVQSRADAAPGAYFFAAGVVYGRDRRRSMAFTTERRPARPRDLADGPPYR